MSFLDRMRQAAQAVSVNNAAIASVKKHLASGKSGDDLREAVLADMGQRYANQATASSVSAGSLPWATILQIIMTILAMFVKPEPPTPTT